MKVFLTGISGLLGVNLANELLAGGYHVRGLIRAPEAYEGLQHPNLELIRGDLRDDLTPHCKGCDYIIHAAAETRQNITRYAHYHKINCEATIRLFQSARSCQVKRFIFVTTSSTIGYGEMDHPGDENTGSRYPISSTFYAKSKLEAEKYLLQHSDQLEVVLIHPGFMLGAFDTKPSSGRIVRMGLDKKIILHPPGGKSFVHVKDVARGIISSLSRGVNGEKYLLVHENLSYADFFAKLNRITNQRPILVEVPGFLLIGLGYLGDLLRMVHLRTEFCSINLRSLCIDNYYSNLKSRADLGITYVPVDTAIQDAVEYFRKPPRGCM